jgi:hypothetical protein
MKTGFSHYCDNADDGKCPRGRVEVHTLRRRTPIPAQIEFVATAKGIDASLLVGTPSWIKVASSRAHPAVWKSLDGSDLDHDRRRRSGLRLEKLGHLPSQLALGLPVGRIDCGQQVLL